MVKIKCNHCGEEKNIDFSELNGRIQVICYECLNTTVTYKETDFIGGDWDDLLEKGEATEYQIKGVLAQLEVIVK